MIPLNYDQLKQDAEYKHIVKSQIDKNDFLINYFMKPIIRDLQELISELDYKIKRLD